MFCGEIQRSARIDRLLTANGLWQSCEFGALTTRATKVSENGEQVETVRVAEGIVARRRYVFIKASPWAPFG